MADGEKTLRVLNGGLSATSSGSTRRSLPASARPQQLVEQLQILAFHDPAAVRAISNIVQNELIRVRRAAQGQASADCAGCL